MWTLVKSEITYFKKFGLITYGLPLIYIVSLIYGISYDKTLYDFYRVFCTTIFGMMPVLFIAVTFTSSLKEKRTRKFCSLPVSNNINGISRFTYFLTPMLYLNLLGLFSLTIANNGWHEISNKIIYQYGATSMLLSALYISYEFLMVFEIKNDLIKILLGAGFFAIILTTLFQVDNKLWNIISQAYIGWLYTLISILVLFIGKHLFLKRNNYLDYP